MVHTGEDYSDECLQTTTFGNVDIAELAARLGSIVTFDRRGNLVWMDDFEHGAAKWVLSGTGLGNAQAITTTRARNGTSSMLLTAGSTLNLDAQMTRYMPFPAIGPVGEEFSFSLGSDVDYFIYKMTLLYNDVIYRGEIKFDVTNSKIQYRNSAGVLTDLISPYTLTSSDTYFMTTKLVVDWATNKYKRFIINEATYDMSTLALYSVANPGWNYLHLQIDVWSTAGDNGKLYVDDLIVTQNE